MKNSNSYSYEIVEPRFSPTNHTLGLKGAQIYTVLFVKTGKVIFNVKEDHSIKEARRLFPDVMFPILERISA
jgi:hypothetical protein